MREVGADGIGFDNCPISSGPLKRIGQLHRSGAVLHVEFNLGLRAITLHGDLLHDRVKGLQVQGSLVGQVRLDGNTNFIFGARGALLAPSQKNHKRKKQYDGTCAFHFDLITDDACCFL
jgi:hypothetical protein